MLNKLLASAALIAVSTVSAHAIVVPSAATKFCSGTGSTAYERALSQHECLSKQHQSNLDKWNSESAQRQHNVNDLRNQINNAPENQKPELQRRLKSMQGDYTSQYDSLQRQNRAQEESIRNLSNQYKNLPDSEKSRLGSRLDSQIEQHKSRITQKIDNSTLGKHYQQLKEDREAVQDIKDRAQSARSGVKDLLKGW